MHKDNLHVMQAQEVSALFPQSYSSVPLISGTTPIALPFVRGHTACTIVIPLFHLTYIWFEEVFSQLLTFLECSHTVDFDH